MNPLLQNLRELLEGQQAAGIHDVPRAWVTALAQVNPTVVSNFAQPAASRTAPPAVTAITAPTATASLPTKSAVTVPALAAADPSTRPASSGQQTLSAALHNAPATVPARPSDDSTDPAATLAAIAARVAACKRCGLCAGRIMTVPGEGNPRPELLFIGEGPGADEDRSGRPFVGAAGQLLDKMIVGMGFQRHQVFIANIVKCRPPDNRQPEPDEAAACLPYLLEQVDALRPRLIVTLGATPLKALRGPGPGITTARGTPFTWRGYTVLPTYHPSYLLRNPEMKKPCWDDLKQAVQMLGRSLPTRG